MRLLPVRAAVLRRVSMVVSVSLVASGLFVLTPSLTSPASADPGSETFAYTGAAQTWTVPAGVTAIAVDAYGAQGGDANYGGPGGRVRATLAVSPGDVLQVNVGGQGLKNGSGFNGGGAAANEAYAGGGASDLRRGGTAVSDRVLVAGGGGGAGVFATPLQGAGGAGGAPAGGSGQAGVCSTPGSGGTQTAGGAGGTGSLSPDGGSGSLGQGGSGGGSGYGYFGGGGGGGYYGGGGGGACPSSYPGSGGGGGSSWVGSIGSSVRFDQGHRLGSGTVKISWPPATPAPVTPTPGSSTFAFTGGPQWFTVPDGVGAIAVDLLGAQGGNLDYGGLGGRVRATLAVSPGDVLQVNVGGQGLKNGTGFNGGGAAANEAYAGGGASDVRKNGVTLADRVVVAGGGGGAGVFATSSLGMGGAGGGLVGTAGQAGICASPGGGGTQSAGGAGGTGNLSPNGVAGTAAMGGAGGGSGLGYYGGGGGGGYNGGGGGGACVPQSSYPGPGGGGGSSWAVSSAGAVRNEQGVRRGPGSVKISWPPATPAPVTPTPGSSTFAFTGGPQWFTVPEGVGAIVVDVLGAQGGNVDYGGLGGRSRATLVVSPGDVLQVNVGGQGAMGTGFNDGGQIGNGGGFNGGGGAANVAYAGGGASDVRKNGVTLADRVVVAGGGGGAGVFATSSLGMGGAGGGLVGTAGQAGICASPGGGGTQSAGGAGGTGNLSPNGVAGTAAMGGAGGGSGLGYYGGGGGGGYNGGGGGGACVPQSSYPGPGGGGGSSFISQAHAFSGTTMTGVRTGNGQVTITWPVALDTAGSFGIDSYGEFVNQVFLGSGNLVEQATDADVETSGPDLSLVRTYNSLDSTPGWFGTGWSSTYEKSASVDPTSGDVTIRYPDGRKEIHQHQADGTYTAPVGYVSKLTAAGGGGWTLTQKDRSVTAFDAQGRLVGQSDPYGRTLTFTYSAGKLTVITDSASGRSLTLTWNGNHVETASTDAVSGPGYSGPLTWRYVYSGDLLTKVCDPRNNDPLTGSCTTYAYASSRLTSISRPKGNTALTVGYKTDGRVDWTRNGVGNEVHYDYYDGVSTVTDARGYVSYYFYDPLYRTTMMIDPAGGLTSYTYDANGFRSEVRDPNGNPVKLGYDARGNLVSQTNGTGETTWFAYDASDNVTARRDGRSSGPTDDQYKTSFTYNSAGDKLTETSPATAEHPSGVSQAWTYTAGGENFGFGADVPAGLLRSFFNGAGTTWYAYDTTGDLRSQTDPSGLVHRFDRDALGRITTETLTWDSGQSAVTTRTFDQLGNPLTVTDPAVTNTAVTPSVTNQKQTITDYDANSNPWRVTTRDAGGSSSPTPDRVTTVEFDNADRAWRWTDPEGGVTSKTFDANGNVATVTDAEGRTVRTDYDERNRPTTVTLLGFVDDPIAGSTPRDVVLQRTDYDPAGRTTAEYTPRPNTGGRAGQLDPTGTPMAKRRYAYDQADRLLSVTFEAYHDRSGAGRDVVLESYGYDQAGNKTTVTEGSGLSTTTNTFDEAGRLQSATLEMGTVDRVSDFDYNPAGKATRQTVTQGSSVVETRTHYDSASRPDSVTVENGTTDLTTTVGYDQRGLRIWSVDPRGNVSGATPADHRSDFVYDVAGRLISEQGPAVAIEGVGGTATSGRPTSTYGYDTVGNRVAAVDPRGALTRQSFDRLDRRTRIDHPTYTPPGGSALSPFEAYSYDRVGNLTSSTDRRGQVTDFLFDARNRVVRQLDPLVAGQPSRGATLYAYDDAGGRTSLTDPTGAVTKWSNDDLGRPRTATAVVRQAAPAGSYTSTRDYDDLGNPTYDQDPTGVATTATFDAAAQLSTVTDALGKTTSYGYDAAGRRISEVDPLGRRTDHVFDPAGRETSTVAKEPGTGAVLATVYRTFDPAGNQTAFRSARSASATDDTYRTTFAYDALNRLTEVVEPDSAGPITTSYGYDAAGNTTRVTDGRGNITTSTYTPWNTKGSTVEPSTPGQTALADRTYAVAYDAAGLPTNETQPGVTISRTFDALGRLTDETGTGSGLTSATRSFGYDLAGRRTSIGHPNGAIGLSFDDRSLPLWATTPGGGSVAAAFQYDAAGRMTSRTDAAGTGTFTYTGRGELDTATDPLTGKTTNYDWNDAGQVATVGYNTSPAVTRTYGYDGQGRLATDSLAVSGTVLNSAAYGYDPDGNMTSQTITAAGNAAAGTSSYSYDRSGRLRSWTDPSSAVTDYSYDEAGNRTSAGMTTFTFDARNRLTTEAAGSTTKDYSWSPRGTLTGIDDGTPTAVTFDALGRQTGHGSTSYSYDALDRITTANSTAFSYAGTEIDPVAVGNERFARTPAGELLALEQGGTSRLVGENRHGDLAWLLDANGVISDTRIWDPYGEVAGTSGTTSPSVGYQGDYTDPVSGDVWMGARWYQPTTGTFTSRDTVFGMLKTPVSLNRYTYGNGDPLEHFDPDGRFSLGIGKLISKVSDFFSGRSSSATSTSAPTASTSGSASQQGLGSKIATQQRIQPNQQQRKQLADMKDYLKGHAALPGNWDQAGIDKQTAFFQSAVLSNGGKSRKTFNDLMAMSVDDRTALWNNKGGASLRAIADQDCRRARWSWACRNKDRVTGVLTTVAIGGAALATGGTAGGVASGLLGAAGVGGTAATVTVGAVGGLAGSATAQKLTTGNVSGKKLAIDTALGGVLALAGRALSTGRAGQTAAIAPRTTNFVDDLAGAACSFSAATAVVMADGTTKAISQVEVGDYVLAEDPETGERGPRKVTHVWAHEDTVVDLEIDGGLVTTTEDHPFWNATDEEWQEAQDLDVGDLVRTADGEVAAVHGLNLRSGRITMAFNLTVDGIHTYFVAAGEDQILVHNTCAEPLSRAGHIAKRFGVSTREAKDAIHAAKQNLPKGGPIRNPNVIVDGATGEIYPQIKGGGHGDSIGNIWDYLSGG